MILTIKDDNPTSLALFNVLTLPLINMRFCWVGGHRLSQCTNHDYLDAQIVLESPLVFRANSKFCLFDFLKCFRAFFWCFTSPKELILVVRWGRWVNVLTMIFNGCRDFFWIYCRLLDQNWQFFRLSLMLLLPTLNNLHVHIEGKNMFKKYTKHYLLQMHNLLLNLISRQKLIILSLTYIETSFVNFL